MIPVQPKTARRWLTAAKWVLLAVLLSGAVAAAGLLLLRPIAVTHDERMIEGFDRVYHMVDGRIDPRGRPSRAPRDENGVRPPTAQA